ncbi:MAG: hypothetical protein ACTSUE_05505 [Promethearchaeota archaeon]
MEVIPSRPIDVRTPEPPPEQNPYHRRAMEHMVLEKQDCVDVENIILDTLPEELTQILRTSPHLRNVIVHDILSYAKLNLQKFSKQSPTMISDRTLPRTFSYTKILDLYKNMVRTIAQQRAQMYLRRYTGFRSQLLFASFSSQNWCALCGRNQQTREEEFAVINAHTVCHITCVVGQKLKSERLEQRYPKL